MSIWPVSYLVHVDPVTGDWVDSPVDLSAARLVAESRTGAHEVWRNPDGGLWQTFWLKSGNVEVTELTSIPPSLTRRYL